MTTPRRTVAYEQVEGPQSRMMRDAFGGPGTVTDAERRNPPGLDRYWCAADRPKTDDPNFRLRRVAQNKRLPEGARCETCGIRIEELQRTVAETLNRIYGQKP